jgi:hypothetical protein
MWGVINFVYVGSHRLCICGESSALYMWGVISFVYVGSHWLFCNLTDMHQKPSAYFSLHVGIVPEVYQQRWCRSMLEEMEMVQKHVGGNGDGAEAC